MIGGVWLEWCGWWCCGWWCVVGVVWLVVLWLVVCGEKVITH